MTSVTSYERAVAEGVTSAGLRSIARWHDRVLRSSKNRGGKGPRLTDREIDRHEIIIDQLCDVADQLDDAYEMRRAA